MTHPIWTYVLLALSALIAGAVNAIAGGGTILTFPALMGLGGVSPVVANATSTIALMPGSVAGAWAFRREMHEARRWLILLVGPSVVGGLVGSLLVSRLNPKYFAMLVPWLILMAAMLFSLQPLLTRRKSADGLEAHPSPLKLFGLLLFQLGVAIYGGYFGAGIGILMLSSLGAMGLRDIHQMNAVKNVMAACINGVSVFIFIANGLIDWRYAAVMSVSAVIGAYAGGRVARRMKPQVVRNIVTTIGFSLAAYYFYKQFVQ